MKFTHNGNVYATTDAKFCDKCHFFWRDGGLYDACVHPNQEFVKTTCGREQREKLVNVIWMKLKPWMTLEHCPVCEHKGSQHDMNCLECCPAIPFRARCQDSKAPLDPGLYQNGHCCG